MPTSKELAEETLASIQKFRREVRGSPEKARAFLRSIGIEPGPKRKRPARRSKR